MLQLIKNLLTNLGLNITQVPDLVIVVAVIIVLVIVLRILHEILETLLSLGCIVISFVVIAWLLIEVFG
ncbi:MAG TPA: hypothetical protein ENJ56_01085 [Anaerolineae bacterium]|nr:hypothetical protein [Anaerolineae bacterium]